MVKNNSSPITKQPKVDDQSIDWSFLIKKGLYMTLILGVFVTIVFVTYLAGLFALFSSDNPMGRFIDEHENLTAFLSLILIISASLWLVTKLSKKPGNIKNK